MTTYSLNVFGTIVRSDGATIPADPSNADYRAYEAWVAAGNAVTPYGGPAMNVPTCQLWQIEAICNAPPSGLGFTPPTWATVTSAVAAQNNAAATAFFAHGTNQIPASSTTLATIAAALTPTLTSAQLTALVAAAAQVAIV